MAGTVTISEVRTGSVKKVTFDWVCDASGNADATTTYAYDGMIIGMITDPGATAPTDNYDVAITDADGDDVLLNAGANRDTATTEYVSTGMAGVANSKLTLAITNAGNAKEGSVTLFIR